MTTTECDLLIVGGGPAGFSAAINGSSEGLHVILIDSGPETGGQAIKSSLIENYPGFPDGVTGEKLMGNFVAQAAKFRTDVRCPEKAVSLQQDGTRRIITNDAGDSYVAKAIILAGGLSYNRLPAENVGQLMGRGVYLGAPSFNPHVTGECDILIVGGANSAGQAAMHASRNPDARVKILVRKTLDAQMSTYLVERIRVCKNIEVLEGVEVTKVSGKTKLQWVFVKDSKGAVSKLRAHQLLVFIGASPKVQWLDGAIKFDERKFILTGTQLITREFWTLNRPPLDHESFMPGVFVAGDVRYGSTKRIVSATGEGGMALQECHDYLRMLNGG